MRIRTLEDLKHLIGKRFIVLGSFGKKLDTDYERLGKHLSIHDDQGFSVFAQGHEHNMGIYIHIGRRVKVLGVEENMAAKEEKLKRKAEEKYGPLT